MNIVLERIQKRRLSTIGVLRVGDLEVFTLEDPVRDHKVYGDTAIPAGRYRLELQRAGKMHPRYQLRFPSIHKGMLHLLDVPNYAGIFIHCGNVPKDTLGCILVGMSWSNDSVGQSVEAYKLMYPIIAAAVETEDLVEISIYDKMLK